VKICHIYPSISFVKGGGSSKVINEIIKHSEDKINHSILCAYNRNDRNDGEKHYPENTKFYYVNSDFFPLSCLQYRLKYNEIKNNDIFHFHNFPVGREFLLFRLLVTKEKRIILSFHIDIDNLIENILMKKYYHLLFRKTIRYWDKIIFHSKRTLQQSKIKYKIRDSFIQFLPIGVNLDFIKNVDARNMSGNPSIVFIGHLTQIKGIDLLLYAFNKVIEKHSEAFLHIIGNKNVDKYQNLANKLNIIDNVQFLGNDLNKKEIISIIKGSDFCIFPSRYDTFNIAALEAIASDKAIIVSNNCGIADELKNKKNAVIIDPDVSQISTAIEKFIADKDLMKSIVKQNKKIINKYDWKKIIKFYIEFYKEIYYNK